jgi:arylsulfatase A-like enzyme
MTMDIFATICAVAGVRVEHAVDARSFLPTLLGKPQEDVDGHRDLFFHRREGGQRYQGLTIAAVRRGDWKLLRNSPFAPFELYNLKADPGEQNDLAARNRQVFGQLSAALRLQVQRGGAVPWQKRSD